MKQSVLLVEDEKIVRVSLADALKAEGYTVLPVEDGRKALQHLNDQMGTAVQFDAEAVQVLMHYGFPGNVRELLNIIERSIALANDTTIRRADLPPHIAGTRQRKTPLLTLQEIAAEAEKKAILPRSCGLPTATDRRPLKYWGSAGKRSGKESTVTSLTCRSNRTYTAAIPHRFANVTRSVSIQPLTLHVRPQLLLFTKKCSNPGRFRPYRIALFA